MDFSSTYWQVSKPASKTDTIMLQPTETSTHDQYAIALTTYLNAKSRSEHDEFNSSNSKIPSNVRSSVSIVEYSVRHSHSHTDVNQNTL